jgi:Baseplate J-like protein
MSSETSSPPSQGTSQDQRTPAALDPSSAPLDHRSPAQLCRDARIFAGKMAFWTSQNQVESRISWADFLPDFDQPHPETEAAQHAQQALFLTYLQLFEHAQDDLNGLTERHLNFYYRDILRLAPLLARADQTHLTLTLKKSVAEARVPLGTLFATADKLTYQSTEEVFLRQSQLAHIRTIYLDPVTQIARAAPVSNSADGLGSELPVEDASWHPFGHHRPLLPRAECGFALSAPVLVMREGTREITVILKLDFTSTPPSEALIIAYFSTQMIASLSGEKVWIPAGSPVVTIGKIGTYSVTVTLVYKVPSTAPAISPYNLTVLTGAFDTVSPVMKWTCADAANSPVAAALSSALIREISLKVSVTGMKDVDLENDHGKIDPSKPFYPFGPLPQQGSSFYIGAEEALHKSVTAATLTINWKNPPSNFATHYGAYPSGATMTNGSFTSQFQILKNGQFEDLTSSAKSLFATPDAMAQTLIDSTSTALSFHKLNAVQYHQSFSKKVSQARVELPFSRVSISKPLNTLALAPVLAFRTDIALPALQGRSRLSAKSHQGFLRLRLNKSFGQDLYPALFAAAVSHNSQPANAAAANQKPVPKAPYLPEISTFALSYKAETPSVNPNLTDAANFKAREIRLFHLHPFGQREEHGHIKSTLQVSDTRITLLPGRDGEGQLLLGLTDLAADQSISLLFQVKDGTADPNSVRQKIEWSVLASNHWRILKDHEILLDTTNSFLASGIIRFLIPRGTSTNNTLLEPGLTWLRARVISQTQAVCRLRSIHPNAIPVTLTNASLGGHLEAGLPAKSIAAAVPPIRGVKEICQPFASTGGAAPEQDSAFRTRVSERLRHRGRASSAWDYERLVLQNFPGIYQAQTLNHTNRDLDRQPGHVTLVVLPDRRSSESAISLTPQVDIAMLSEINDFLTRIASPFVTVAAVNPAFEPIHLAFKVAFRSGLPFSSYREILRTDIQSHLAPWAFTGADRVDFGGHLYRSALIAFIDALPYVDYLTDFELFHQAFGTAARSVQTATASRLGAILTPTALHVILPVP